MNIIWTQYALNDLRAIRPYLTTSESAAFARKITQEDNPLMLCLPFADMPAF